MMDPVNRTRSSSPVDDFKFDMSKTVDPISSPDRTKTKKVESNSHSSIAPSASIKKDLVVFSSYESLCKNLLAAFKDAGGDKDNEFLKKHKLTLSTNLLTASQFEEIENFLKREQSC